MKKIFIFLLPIFCITLYSCQKEVTDTLAGTENGSTDSTKLDTYLPLTNDTHWKYQDSASSDLTTMLVLDQTKTISGRSYKAVLGTNSTQSDTFYMTQENHDYYNYAQVDNGTSSGTFLFHYLNDAAATGSSWEYLAGQGNGFQAYFKTTIVERDLSRTVQNKTYTQVIHTRMELMYDISGERVPAGTYDYYIAKGVGIIQVKSNLGMYGFEMVASSDLIEYEIK